MGRAGEGEEDHARELTRFAVPARLPPIQPDTRTRLMVWWSAGRSPRAPDPAALASRVETFRALESDVEVAYLWPSSEPAAAASLETALRSAYPSARITRQHLLQECPGSSAGEDAPFHYIVATDVRPDAENDFNAWYEREHLPGLAGVPGTANAQRLRNADDGPRYHACYDLVSVETLGSPAWLAVRGTPWSSRVRPSFRNTTRLMMRRV